jgi:hypothetical protein
VRRLGIATVGTLLMALVVAPATAASAATTQPHGLRGDYYVSAAGTYDQFTTLKATVVDPNIDFNDLEPVLDSLTLRDLHVLNGRRQRLPAVGRQ